LSLYLTMMIHCTAEIAFSTPYLEFKTDFIRTDFYLYLGTYYVLYSCNGYTRCTPHWHHYAPPVTRWNRRFSRSGMTNIDSARSDWSLRQPLCVTFFSTWSLWNRSKTAEIPILCISNAQASNTFRHSYCIVVGAKNRKHNNSEPRSR